MRKATVQQVMVTANTINYVILENNAVVYDAKIHFEVQQISIILYAPTGEVCFSLYFSSKEMKKHFFPILKLKKIYKKKKLIAHIQKKKKNNYMIFFDNNKYVMYHVNFKNPVFQLPVYCNKMQTALIEKKFVSKNAMHCYEVSAAKEDLLEIIVLFVLYIDKVRYSFMKQAQSEQVNYQLAFFSDKK